MKRLNLNASIESFLVMLLMIAFTVSIALIIIAGKGAFERVSENKKEDEEARIALSYVNKQIRQNDMVGMIEVVEDAVEGHTALRIKHEEDYLYTYIFYSKGILYECYTDLQPTLALSSEIIPVKNVSFKQNGSIIHMTLLYEYHGVDMELTQSTYLRTGGSYE